MSDQLDPSTAEVILTLIAGIFIVLGGILGTCLGMFYPDPVFVKATRNRYRSRDEAIIDITAKMVVGCILGGIMGGVIGRLLPIMIPIGMLSYGVAYWITTGKKFDYHHRR